MTLNTLDFSWQSDITERLLHGYLVGRDFIFTYGPIYQILQSVPSLFFKAPSYISVLFFPLILTLINFILIFIILKLLFFKKKIIKLFIIILILTSFVYPIDANSLTRILIPLFFSLIYYRFSFLKNFLSVKKILTLLLPSFLGLYSFDLFVFALIILIIFLILETFMKVFKEKKNNYSTISKIIILTILPALITVTAFEVLISLVLSKNLNYIIYSLDTIKNYQFIMNIPFSSHQNYFPLLFPVFSAIILFVSLKKKLFLKTENIPFVIIFLTAILQLKSAITRADDSHIFQGAYPSLIILTIISYLWFEKLKKIYILVVFLLIIVYLNFSFKNLFENYYFLKTDLSFFNIYKLSGKYYFTKNDFDYFSKLIKNNPGNVMVYPYDSFILNINNQTHNTLPLQFYAYSNSKVEKQAVEKLSESPPKFIILGIDTKTAVNLDDIPNFSRNPFVAKWIINNYSIYEDKKNYLVLAYDSNKKNIKNDISDCSIYEIDTRNIMKSNILESILKSSTYYLIFKDNKIIRLPYAPSTTSVLVFENYDKPKELKKIIENGIDFNNYSSENKNLNIVKKYPIPVFRKELYRFNVKCF